MPMDEIRSPDILFAAQNRSISAADAADPLWYKDAVVYQPHVLTQVGAFLPRLALAIFMIFVGWLGAKAVRSPSSACCER